MESSVKVAVVVLAAGSGQRFGHEINKVWLPISGKRIISRSLLNATESFPNARTVLVINPDDEGLAREIIEHEVGELNVEIVYGGATRHESELCALVHLAQAIEFDEIEVVLIHDGARPLATPKTFADIAEAAHLYGGAIPTIPVDQREMDTKLAERVVRVQTPQGFIARPLLEAYRLASIDGFIGTDTAACMEKYFPEVRTKAIEADLSNIKITYQQDLVMAEAVLAQREGLH